jgi:hypothetical protein
VSVSEGSVMPKKDQELLTRREVLAVLTRAGATAPLALNATLLAGQAPKAPANVKVIDSAGGAAAKSGKAVLTPDDLVFRGFIRLSREAGTLWYSHGRLAIRKVGGQTRAFLTGNQTERTPILEFNLPDTPDTDLAKAPIAELTKSWPGLMNDRALTGGGAGFVPGGLHWDSDRNALWWSYGDIYVPTQSHPTIGCSILNDSAGTATSFGPWRTEWSCQRTRGGFIPIPPSFASTYLSGKTVGIMSTQSAGNRTSPFGAILSGMALPDPSTVPADVTTNTHWTIANHGLLLHDIDHRQARDTRYRTCGWKVAYDCRAGAVVRPTNPGLFGGDDPASGVNDTMTACVWVDLSDKHGLLYFGHLVTTPEGYTAPGDPDGYVHMWYGAPLRNDGSAPKTCCHGQDDPYWQATGPGAHYRVQMGWIYNPDDLVATATRKADLWSRTPTSTFQLKSRAAAFDRRYPAGALSGAAFDGQTRRIYAAIRQDAITVGPNSRPAIAVFDVKS